MQHDDKLVTASRQGRETHGLWATQNRQRFFVATLIPILTPRAGDTGGGVPSSTSRTASSGMGRTHE